jgi:hypothetical protein
VFSIRVVAAFLLAFGLAACGSEPKLTMPDVVGKRLDVAQSDVRHAGFAGDVEVVGGGIFGIVDESNWLVCEQKPAAGQEMVEPPRLMVARSCGGDATQSAQESQPVPTTEPEADGTNFRFGQTAHFTSTAGSNNNPLEFTVSAPTAFTPSKNATVFDKRSAVGGLEGTLQPVNVYFTVTIKNLSSTQAYDPDFVFSDVAETTADESVAEVIDGEIEGTTALEEIPPGKSIIIKDGYSVKNADNIVYELDVDGLAGKSFYWSR